MWDAPMDVAESRVWGVALKSDSKFFADEPNQCGGALREADTPYGKEPQVWGGAPSRLGYITGFGGVGLGQFGFG